MSMTSVSRRVSVIGVGYLGLTHAVCLADFGHEVLAIDVDAAKIAQAAAAGAVLRAGPGAAAAQARWTRPARFTSCYAEVAEFGDVHFLCVGTPQPPNGAADLSQLNAAADALAPHLPGPCLIVGQVHRPGGHGAGAARPGSGRGPGGRRRSSWPGTPSSCARATRCQDSLRPDRIVVGTTARGGAGRGCARSTPSRSAQGIPALVMDLETAELVKVAANAFLATKISFINAMAEVCEAAGGRRGPAGRGAGPRRADRQPVPAPRASASAVAACPRTSAPSAPPRPELGIGSVASLLGEVDAINMRPPRPARSTWPGELVGGSLAGSGSARLGVAFKPDSDDIRDSPSLDICDRLAAEGAIVTVHDPVAMATRPGSAPTCATRDSA